MWHVLWSTVIFNSIFISKQVLYTGFEAKTSLRNSPKTVSHTPLKHKLRNFRNQLRKESRRYGKIDIEDWGYKDISEPLQYKFKEVWWTKDYPDSAVKTRKPTKNNIFHKSLTKNKNKLNKHPTIFSTNKSIVKQNLRMRTNTTKLFTKVTKKGLVKQTKVYGQPSLKSPIRTIQIERLFTKLNYEHNGVFLPEYSRDDNSAFSILANQTDTSFKINENNSDIRGSKTNNSFKNMVKDRIYRTEIPESVTKKTNINNEIETKIDKRVPKILQPPNPFEEDAISDHKINSESRQGPFRNIKRPRPGAGPLYNPNDFGQNSRQGPIYNLHSSQNPGYDRQAPFYGPNNLLKTGQGPFYNPQYSGYNRQDPIYGPNNLGQNGQTPFYNPQNLGYDGQRPIYDTNNLDQNEQASNYKLQHGQGSFQYAENSPDDIQDPPSSTPNLNDHSQSPVYNTQGTQAPVAKDFVSIEPPTNPPERVETSTNTLAPGEGPDKEHAPVEIDGPKIELLSPFVRQMQEDMRLLQTGYFSMFLIRFFELVAKIDDEALGQLLAHAEREAKRVADLENFVEQFGEPFVFSLKGLASLQKIPVESVKDRAFMFHYAMLNRDDAFTNDFNSFIDYIDTLIEENEGIELFKVVEDMQELLHPQPDRIKLYRKLSKALSQPYKRLSGTPQKQILFDSWSKLTEKNRKPLEGFPTDPEDFVIVQPELGDLAKRIGNNFDKYLMFHSTKYIGPKSKVTLMGRNYQYQNHKKKDIPYKQSTKGYLLESSYEKSADIKKFFTRTKLQKLKKSTKHNLKDKKSWIATKNTNNNKGLTSKIHYSKALVSKINKTTYFIPPLAETTVKTVPSTVKDISSYQPVYAISTQNVKINKIKEVISDQFFQAKAENYISKSEQTNIVRYDTSYDEEETKEGGIEIQETGATTAKPLKASNDSKVKHREKKSKHKRKKNIHFNKKEIRHLRHEHPKLYKSYLKYFKREKHNGNHKKKTNNRKKKSRHYKRKKRNKKIPRDIEHHFDHLLKHYMLKRTDLEARLNNSENDISKECKHKLRGKNVSIESPYIYDSYRSIETDMSKNINDNVMTPNFPFITPFSHDIRQPVNYESTTKWVHYPITQKTLRASNQNFQVPDHGISYNFATDDSMEFSGSMPVWDDNPKKSEIKQSSSYSYDDYELKLKLYDAMRHDNFYFNPQRRSMNITEDKNKLNTFSSYSSEEVVLKSNIYKALDFNKYHCRANFSDIVKKDSIENSKKVSRRSRFIPDNEMTSHSDDEEVILKKKLKP